MIDEGFIKIHRKILKWEWYRDKNVVKLFLHCLILANHKAKKWEGRTIERGQFASSYDKLASGCGMSVREIRTALNKLKTTNEVTSESTNKYTMITINNYNTYHMKGMLSDTQIDTQSDKRKTNERQTKDKRKTTTKNVKNVKNVKNKETYIDFVKLTKEEYEKLIKKFGKEGTEQRIWNLNDYGHRKKKKFNEYTDHYRTILNWERRDINGKNNRERKQEPIKKARTHSESRDSGRKGVSPKITIED